LSTLCHANKLDAWKLPLIIQTFMRSCIQVFLLAFSPLP